jgi:hypothetical protein
VRSGARYQGVKRRLLNGDTGAAFGLIAGIIIGSLALNLSGWAQDAATQSAPRTAAVAWAAATGSVAASQR